MKLKKEYIILIAAIIIAAVCAFFGLKAIYGKKQMSKRSYAQTSFSVATKVLEEQTLHDYVITNGEIESQRQVEIYPDQAGKLVECYVSLGTQVKRGQVIAKVDPSSPGVYFALSPVISPISGSILSTPLRTGATVSKSTPITIVGDTNNLQVTANIPERYVSFLKTGLKADVKVQAYPDVVFPASITKVSPVVDKLSRTKQIILTFDHNDERINAGMFGQVILYIRDLSGTVVMDSSSLQTRGDKTYAFVVKEDGETVEQREVTLGEQVDGVYQIYSGLKVGERVVTEGVASLSEGAKIIDVNASKENKKGDE